MKETKQKRSNWYIYFINTKRGLEVFNSLYDLLDSQGYKLPRTNNEANAYRVVGKHKPSLIKEGSTDPVAGEWKEIPGYLGDQPIYRVKRENLMGLVECPKCEVA